MTDSTPIKRAARYARVAGAAARLGADRLIGHKDQGPLMRAVLGGLKGPLMKVGQLVAVIPDLLPPDYAKELATLQAHAPSMGWPFIKRRMIHELGPYWMDHFISFDRQARFAASLGQVHYAKTKVEQGVACKLQYPDMQSTVDADLRQLKILFALFERMGGAVSTHDVYEEIKDRLSEELDYKREAKNIDLYQSILNDYDEFHIPKVFSKLSTDRLLTMSWLEGETLDEIIERAKQKEKNTIAANLFRLWYMPLYQHGVIHGDPHPGNYTFRKEGQINLLDFGCIRKFKPDTVRAIIKLYHALLENDEEKAVEAYRLWGFTNMSKELLEALNLWARFVYGPVLQEGVHGLEATNSTVMGQQVARQVYQAVKKIGGVSVPRPFVIIDRASVGLGSVFLRLHAELNWQRLFEDMISLNPKR